MARLYERFNIHQRLQHIMMFTSFIICTVTGLPIKYDYTAWAAVVTSFFGGFDNMFRLHLVGATIMLACSAYHLVYLVVYPLVTKKVSWAAMPNLKDVRDLLENMRYLLGLSQHRPQFDRYSYKEKFDYWAVFWGMAIMGGSGLMMWFPHWATRYFPRWVIDSARFAHSDEAMLAILAIFLWHFFNVHFNPKTFPMSWVWYHGKISEEDLAEEHPLEYARLQQAEQAKGGGAKWPTEKGSTAKAGG